MSGRMSVGTYRGVQWARLPFERVFPHVTRGRTLYYFTRANDIDDGKQEFTGEHWRTLRDMKAAIDDDLDLAAPPDRQAAPGSTPGGAFARQLGRAVKRCET